MRNGLVMDEPTSDIRLSNNITKTAKCWIICICSIICSSESVVLCNYSAIVPVMRSDVLSVCISPLLALHFNCHQRPVFVIILRACFMVVLSLMRNSSYITRCLVFQTLKATTAKARLNSSLARLICAAMVAVVGSASFLA